MSLCMTPAGVKYISGVMYDSCRSQVSGMYDSCRSQVSQCMTPAGVKYVIMYDSCRSQVCHYV